MLPLASCDSLLNKEEDTGQKVIATYAEQELLADELTYFTPAELSGEDSIAYAERFIDQWMRDQVIAEAAKQAMPGISKQIEYKMQDEERKWLKHKYTDYLILRSMDTIVSHEELLDYYHKNLENYISKAQYYCYFHVQTTLANQYQLVGWLKGSEEAEIKQALQWSIENATEYRLDTTFVTEMELERISKGYYGDLKRVKKDVVYNYEHETDSLRFFNFFKLIDVIQPNEALPLSAVKERIRLYILSQRKQLLIEKQVANLMEQAESQKKIKRHTNE